MSYLSGIGRFRLPTDSLTAPHGRGSHWGVSASVRLGKASNQPVRDQAWKAPYCIRNLRQWEQRRYDYPVSARAGAGD